MSFDEMKKSGQVLNGTKKLGKSHPSSVSSTVRLPSSVRNRCGVSNGAGRGCSVEGGGGWRRREAAACVSASAAATASFRSISLSSTRRSSRKPIQARDGGSSSFDSIVQKRASREGAPRLFSPPEKNKIESLMPLAKVFLASTPASLCSSMLSSCKKEKKRKERERL